MRRFLKVAVSIALFAVGAIWFLLELIGTAATVMDLFEWVPIWVRKLAAHEELVFQIAPWFLMGLGVASLLIVHFWADRILVADSSARAVSQGQHRSLAERTSVEITPRMVRAMRISKAAADAGRAIQQSYEAADRELSRIEDLLRKAHERKPDLFPNDLIPLCEAAQLLYEVARERNRLLAVAAERMSGNKNGAMASGTPEDILDYMATYIGGKAHLYGARPPSEKLEFISRDESKGGKFESGALVLKGWHVYTDLAVSKSELYRIIAALEASEI